MRAIAGWVVATGLIVAAMIAFRIDISAARFFRSDVAVRDAFGSVSEPPYYDPAPYSLWLPSDWFVWDSLRSGHLPLWDRMQGGGYSPVTTVQNGVFHPMRWIVAVAPREIAPSVLIVIAVAAAAGGMWLLLRVENGLSRWAAATGAILFVCSSPLASSLHFSGDLLPLAHTPWVVFFAQRNARTHSAGAFAGLVVSMALLFLAGHPLFALTAGLAALGFVVADAFAARSARPLLVFAAAIVFALAIDAFAFLPPAAELPDLWSYKTQTNQGSVYAVFAPFERWLRAIGSMLVDARKPRSNFDDVEFWIYVGLPAAILACVGVIDALQRTRDRVVAGVLLSFFVLTVPGPWMSDVASMKPLTFMNRSYFAGGMAFAAAVVAAGGFEFLRRRNRVTRVVAFTCAAFAVLLALIRENEVLRPHRWTPIVEGDVVAALRGKRITGSRGQAHLPNSSRITGIEDIRESTPIWTVRKHLWWEAVDPKIRRFLFPTFRMTDRVDSPLVGGFNAGYVVWSRLKHAGFHNAAGSSMPPAGAVVELERPSVLVLRWPGVIRPRAHFADRVAAARTREDAARLLREQPGVSVVEWGTTAPPPVLGTGIVTVAYPSECTVVMDSESATGGLVVLHDAFDRGWRARLDGRDVPIVPVSLISRGVVVGSGRHRVTMAYEPPAFRAGAGISAVAIMSLGVAAAIVERRRRIGASRGGITPSEPALGGYRA